MTNAHSIYSTDKSNKSKTITEKHSDNYVSHTIPQKRQIKKTGYRLSGVIKVAGLGLLVPPVPVLRQPKL